MLRRTRVCGCLALGLALLVAGPAWAGHDEYVSWPLTDHFADKPVAKAWGLAFQQMDWTTYQWSIMYSDGIRSFPVARSAGMSPHASDSMLAWYDWGGWNHDFFAVLPSDIPAIVSGPKDELGYPQDVVKTLFTSTENDYIYEIYYRVSERRLAVLEVKGWPLQLTLFTVGDDGAVKREAITPPDVQFPDGLDFALDGTRCLWKDQVWDTLGKLWIYDAATGQNTPFDAPARNTPGWTIDWSSGASWESVGNLALKGDFAAWTYNATIDWAPVGYAIYVNDLRTGKTTAIEQGEDGLAVVDLDATGRLLYAKAAMMPSGSVSNQLWYWDGHKSVRIADSMGEGDGVGDGAYTEAILAGDRIIAVGPNSYWQWGTYPGGYVYVYDLDDLELRASLVDGEPIAVPKEQLGGEQLWAGGNIQIAGTSIVWSSPPAIAMPLRETLDALYRSVTFGDLRPDIQADLAATLTTAKAALFPPGPRDTAAGKAALLEFVMKAASYGSELKEQTGSFIRPALAAYVVLSSKTQVARK